jgi:hypothetical protein
MRKAAHHTGGMYSSNPRCWRGKRLHHHGGDVRCVVLWLCVAGSLVVRKKVPEHNLKVRILLYYKVNRHFLVPHIGMHHTIHFSASTGQNAVL